MTLDSALDLCLRTRWRRGAAAAFAGPLLLSYTEFTPSAMRDLPAIYRAAGRLLDACEGLEGAVGVAVYWRLPRRRVGSLSAWTGPDALRRFVSLPLHLEVMRRFRDRGSLRSAEWRAEGFELRAALRDGARAVEMAGGGGGAR